MTLSKGTAMKHSPVDTSELAILSRVLEPDHPPLTAAAARSLLTLGFHEADKDRMRQLSAKAREGTLTSKEQVEINNYERVGHLLNLLQSRARRALQRRRDRNGEAKTP
jgi:hypothetical protein